MVLEGEGVVPVTVSCVWYVEVSFVLNYVVIDEAMAIKKKKRRKEARATPSPLQKVLDLFQSNRMFLSIFWYILYRLLLGPLNFLIIQGSQVFGPDKSLAWQYLYGGVLFKLRMECIRSRLFVLLYAALAQSGLLSEPQQICGEETRYHPWKNQVCS